MIDIIKRYCNDTTLNNGLLLIDSPTGSGKTHNVMQFICDSVCKFICDKVCTDLNTKIFYITSLKKNLPENDLAKMFLEKGKKIFLMKNFYISILILSRLKKHDQK